MCIKIVNSLQEVKYDANVPLENQICSSDRIVVNYEPKDPDIDTFLGEMERLCRSGISANVNVEVTHNNNLKGARTRNQLKRLMKDLNVNEAIKLLATLHHTADRYLGELADYCQKR
jgi:hypothetical protein